MRPAYNCENSSWIGSSIKINGKCGTKAKLSRWTERNMQNLVNLGRFVLSPPPPLPQEIHFCSSFCQWLFNLQPLNSFLFYFTARLNYYCAPQFRDVRVVVLIINVQFRTKLISSIIIHLSSQNRCWQHLHLGDNP